MHRLHHHYGIVDHNPDGKNQSEKRKHIDREPQHLHEKERADQRDRDRDGGNQSRADILEENIHHDKHQQESLEQRFQHRLDGSVEKPRHVIRDVIIHSRSKTALFDFLHPLLDVLNHLAGVRARPLLNHDRSRRTPVGHGNHVVVFRVKLDCSHILQPEQRAVGQSLQHDFAILLRSAELTRILKHILQLLRQTVGTDTRLAGSRLDILFADSLGHVLGNHVISRQTVRVQPYAHGVVPASHNLHEPHAVNTFQLPQDVDVRKIIDKLLGVRAVAAEYVQIHQHAVHLLLRHHAGPDNLLRQLVEHRRHTVLHVDSRHVGVRPYLEIHSRERHAVVGTYGSHIRHSRHAVDSAFQRSRNRFGHHVRAGARVARRHRHCGRHDVRKLGDRQRYDRKRPQTHDNHGNYRRKNRSSDK